MNSAGIILFFILVTIVALAGIILAGFGVRRLQQERVTHPGADKGTMVRCCGIDLLIALIGIGLISVVTFSAYRIVLG